MAKSLPGQQLAEVEAVASLGSAMARAYASATMSATTAVDQSLDAGSGRSCSAANRVHARVERTRRGVRPGDRLSSIRRPARLLHVPRPTMPTPPSPSGVAATARSPSWRACTDDQITAFFELFADRLADDDLFAPIAAANARRRRARPRSGPVDDSARAHVDVDAVRHDRRAARLGRERPPTVTRVERSSQHDGWSLEARRAPLGVVGFVFEGRPNVFADAAGVVRTGNTVVFRIGSDALGTARAIVEHALDPALAAAGSAGGHGRPRRVGRRTLPAGRCSPTRGCRWRSPAGRAPPSPSSARSPARPGCRSVCTAPGGAWLVAAPDADAHALARGARALARPQGVQHPERVLCRALAGPTS